MVKKDSIYTKDIILILAASFFFMAGPMLATPLIPGFSETLGAGGFIMGFIGGLMNICSLCCRPIVGGMTDRVSKYRFATVGTSLIFIATSGYILAPSMIVVVAARIVNGVGFSCCTVCMATWMADLLPKNRIGMGMGLYGTMNALSMAIAPAIGVYVKDAFGFRAAFIVSGMFALGALITVQFIGNKGVPIAEMKEKKKTKLVEVKALPIAAIIMLFAIPYCATQSFLVPYVEAREIAISAGIFFPIYAVFLFVLRFGLKSRFDRWPYGWFFYGACACAILSMAALNSLASLWIMVAAAVFMAGGYGIMCSVSQSACILLAGKGKRGVANSTYYIGLDLGMAVGPLIGGILYGNVPLDHFYITLMICVPLSIAVYVIWRLTQKKNM